MHSIYAKKKADEVKPQRNFTTPAYCSIRLPNSSGCALYSHPKMQMSACCVKSLNIICTLNCIHRIQEVKCLSHYSASVWTNLTVTCLDSLKYRDGSERINHNRGQNMRCFDCRQIKLKPDPPAGCGTGADFKDGPILLSTRRRHSSTVS